VRNISENRGSNPITDVLEQLNGAKTGASFLPRLNLIDFEKDDEANGHVSFVTAASNLRALAYGIPPADAMETRRVAGSIVPAMITTTGLVSALSCLELMKMLKGLPLTMHRNAFVNLALPFFAFTAPLPAQQCTGVNGREYTTWDRIVVKGSSKSPVDSMTLRKFLDKIKKSAGLGDEIEVSNVSYGPYMIYANFLNAEDEELLASPLMDALRSAVISEEGLDENLLNEGSEAHQKTEKVADLTREQKATLSRLARKRYIDFSVVVEHVETGEEYELPPIRLVREKKD
jgi:ubiquitin-activating enzyme E1